MFDFDACSLFIGECFKCFNNIMGFGCVYCEDWYYGDVVIFKNC